MDFNMKHVVEIIIKLENSTIREERGWPPVHYKVSVHKLCVQAFHYNKLVYGSSDSIKLL